MALFDGTYEELSAPFGAPSPSLRCPVSGLLILPGEDEGTGEVTSWEEVGD